MVARAIIDEFLALKALAVVGVSRSGGGYGNVVRKDLAAKGRTVFVVHPEAEAIDGQPCAHSLQEIAGKVDGMVLVTPPDATLELVREAAIVGIRRVWMQPGAESAEAIQFCEQNGLTVVHDHCILNLAE